MTKKEVFSLPALLVCAAFSASAPVCAESWDWTYNASTPAPIDAQPIALSKPDSGGFWARGGGLVHYHPDGTVDFARPDRGYLSALSAGMADGGIVFTSSPYTPPTFPLQYYYCSLAL